MADPTERDGHQTDSTEKRGLTRRAFLGHAAVGAAAVGVGSTLLGAPAAMANTNFATTLPKTWSKTYDVVVIGTGCGLAAAIEAKKAAPSAKVLVIDKADHVGGLYITAGGSFTMGAGPTGPNIVQAASSITDDVETWYQDEMACTDWRAQPELVRILVENGADTVKWFSDLGIVYAPISAGVLRGTIKRGITAQPYDITPLPAGSVAAGKVVKYAGGAGYPNTGIAFTQVMYEEVKRLKIPVMLNTKMTKIYRNEAGVVVGIKATRNGKAMTIKATRGVVVTAGTWTDNEQMMQQYDPRLVGKDCYGDGGTPADGQLYCDSAGDGIRQAQAIGAATADMSFACYCYMFFGGRSYWGWGHNPIDWTKNTEDGTKTGTPTYASGKAIPQAAGTFQNSILVAANGKRYVNESLRISTTYPGGRGGYSENPENPFTDAYLALPETDKGRNVWMIADSATAGPANVDPLAPTGLAWPLGPRTATLLSTLDDPDPKRGAMYDGACIAKANTIAELATKIGVDPTVLQAEVNKYNGFVTAGKDNDFGKPMTVTVKVNNVDTVKPVNKIATGPFYALKASLIRHTQRNGLRCNTKMQVIEQRNGYAETKSIDDLKTIPHLYVAGESGDIFGWKRTHNTLAHYVTAARIAGKNCAKKVAAK